MLPETSGRKTCRSRPLGTWDGMQSRSMQAKGYAQRNYGLTVAVAAQAPFCTAPALSLKRVFRKREWMTYCAPRRSAIMTCNGSVRRLFRSLTTITPLEKLCEIVRDVILQTFRPYNSLGPVSQDRDDVHAAANLLPMLFTCLHIANGREKLRI
jgi:hypothetical protein